MSELITTAEDSRSAEHHIFLAYLVTLSHILRCLPPYEVYHTMSVGEMSDKTLLARRHGKLLKTEYPATNLHKRHCTFQLINTIYFTAVNIFIGIVFQQVAPRLDIEFAV